MSSVERNLFSPEEHRRRARRIKADIVAAAKLPPALKAVLAALWEFCGGNRFCWPSQQTLAARVGYAWPGSRRALQTKLYELEARGLIVIEPAERQDGSTTSNKYRIVWGNLKRTQGENTAVKRRSTVAQTSAGGRLPERPPASEQAPPRAHTSAPPRLPERPLNLYLTCNETRTTPPTNTRDGGGDRVAEKIQTPSASRQGSWAGYIDVKFPRAEVKRLYYAAINAGFIRHSAIDQVRIVALALQAVTRPKGYETGFFVSHVEIGDWQYLSPGHVKEACKKLQDVIQLTPEELALVRLPRGDPPGKAVLQ